MYMLKTNKKKLKTMINNRRNKFNQKKEVAKKKPNQLKRTNNNQPKLRFKKMFKLRK